MMEEKEAEQPSSPRRKPVELRDCIEDLLNFTLRSHFNHTLGFDVGLSEEFCSFLLHHDQNCSDSGKGLPHPLYKHLASALFEYITSGGSSNSEIDLEERGMCNGLVLDEGTKLLNILKTVNFELHVQEPFFTQLKDGLKTVEGRCAVGDYNRIEPGAIILFNNCLLLKVEDIRWYASFYNMLEDESLAKVLPGVKTIDEVKKKHLIFSPHMWFLWWKKALRFTGSFTRRKKKEQTVFMLFVLGNQKSNNLTFLWLKFSLD